MDLGQWLLAKRGMRTGLVLLALAAGVLFAFASESPLLRIAGALFGVLLAVVVKILTEVYLRVRKASTSPADAGAWAQLAETERRLADLSDAKEQLSGPQEPTRRHVLHNGPGMRELRLRDAMDSLEAIDRPRGSIGPDQ
jgi:hypothetical protein